MRLPSCLSRARSARSWSLSAIDPSREVAVEVERVHPLRAFLLEQRPRRSGGRARRRRPRDGKQQRSAVNRQPLDVDRLQPVTVEQVDQRPQREVTEVLVIDGVELGARDHVAEVGELERRHPFVR